MYTEIFTSLKIILYTSRILHLQYILSILCSSAPHQSRTVFYKITTVLYFLPGQCIFPEAADYPNILDMKHTLPQ